MVAGDQDVPHHIVGMYIVCLPRATTVVLSDEHNEYAWVNSDEIDQYHIVSPNDQAIRLALNGRTASLTSEKRQVVLGVDR